MSGVVSQAAPTRCWRRDAGWILELVGGPGHLGDTWAYQTGASLGPAGCGWEQGGCWPRVLGAAQPLPRSSCRERAAFPADGCSREGRSILQRASPCPSTQRTAAFTESRKEKVQTLLTSGHTELQKGPFGCSWMGCPGLALPPTALQTLRAGQPLLLPWKSVCTATAKKKIVNEKTRWKRGSKLNATAVMLHLSCEGKIKFCLPLEVSSGKIISSLAKWHHIVSSFQPAASLVSRSIFFPGKYSGYLTVVVILHPPPGWI